jgi:hypothetical protein
MLGARAPVAGPGTEGRGWGSSRERHDRRRSPGAGIGPGGANLREGRVEGILKFFGSVVGIIFLIGLVVVIGLLMLIF